MEINFREHFSWLNKNTFETILRRDRRNDDIQVIDLVIKEALAKGENNCSQMLRVTTKFNDGTKDAVERFIVKGMLIHGIPTIIEEMNLFEKEIHIYEDVLPTVQQLLQSIGDDSELSAKLFAASKEHSYLVFEDLSAKRYANLNRRTGLTMEDFRLTFQKAAKWHACTAVILEKNPDSLSYFDKCSFDINNKIWRQIIENVSISLSDACKFLPEFKHLTTKIEAGHATVFERFCNAVAAKSRGFNALSHGDFWSNNIMFQRNPETLVIQNALFVDFQMSCITSPMVDIVYSIFTSSHEDLTEVHWEELIQFYHDELISILEKLCYKGQKPRLVDFHVEMLTRGIYGVMFGLLVLAMRNLPDHEFMDMTKVLGDKEEDREYRRDFMLNPMCRKGLVFILRYIDRKGILDN